MFDEAQRAWTLEQTSNFMKRKKNKPNFNQSEPDFLISCLDRHKDWAVVVCLVGGGQEINTGEAGISEWINSIQNLLEIGMSIFLQSLLIVNIELVKHLIDLVGKINVTYNDALHLSVSMRSFRAENVSLLIKQMLDLNVDEAKINI